MRLGPTPGVALGVGSCLLGATLDREQAILPDPHLMLQGWTLSLVHLLVLGPIVHAFATPLLVRRGALRRVFDFASIVVMHSGLYALAHRAMHKVAALRPIHRDHHRFQKTVIPSAANAVSAQEFLFAYMLPFVVGVTLFRPDPLAFNCAVATVSAFNFIVHSPHLRSANWPGWLVAPSAHLDHHLHRTPNYAAPTFSWSFLSG